MIKTILFDLDGTLLPMDQDVFLKEYFGRLVKKMIPHGYDPKRLTKSIWACTEAMVRNDGKVTNEEIFWERFSEIYGGDVRKDEPVFWSFIRTNFRKSAIPAVSIPAHVKPSGN